MQDYGIDLVKVAPPVVVSTFTLFGYPLQTWVLFLTALYTLLQMYVLIRDKIIRSRVTNDEEKPDA